LLAGLRRKTKGKEREEKRALGYQEKKNPGSYAIPFLDLFREEFLSRWGSLLTGPMMMLRHSGATWNFVEACRSRLRANGRPIGARRTSGPFVGLACASCSIRRSWNRRGEPQENFSLTQRCRRSRAAKSLFPPPLN